MADALATLADDQPAHHRRHHDRPFGVSVNFTHTKLARDPKPPAPASPRAKPKQPRRQVAPAIDQPAVEISGRVLAKITDYDGLWSAIRARVDALGITRIELDHLSGNQEGYSGKLLGAKQVKKFGKNSLGQTVGATGTYLLLVEDPEETAKIMARCEHRKRPVRPPRQLLNGPPEVGT
jgi:hypothetical protein